jgi:oxygen-dependent protoporphyrinogen oxidase
MPDGLMFMVPTKILPVLTSPLFSWKTKLRMAGEWFQKTRAPEGDESVASLVVRHYGEEMVERMIDPLLCGIYGGDAAHLSLQAVLPRFAEMERTSGSLGRAMLKSRRKVSGASKPLFTTLKGGMQQISDAVVKQLPPLAVRCGVAVETLRATATGWTVGTAGEFDAVIVAVPAPVAATMLQNVSADLSSELRAIEYSSSLTVALGYGPEVRKSLPPGFGLLAPRSEGKRLLAATFVHNKFAHRAPPDRALLRCFLGGIHDEAVLELEEDQLVQIVQRELKEILGIEAEPQFFRVYKWRTAMAQYNVGHLDRLRRIEKFMEPFPTLDLAGNAYRGIGIPDCLRSGQDAASQVQKAMQGGSPR